LADLSNAALVTGDVRGLSSASLSCPCPVAVEAPVDVSRLLTPPVAGARVPGAYVRSSQDEAALESALLVNTSVPQVAVQPPIVINVTTNVTTIPISPAREEFLTGMVRTYQTLDEDAATSTLIDQFFSYLMDSCIGGAPGPEDLNWTFNGAVRASVDLALLSPPRARAHPAPCSRDRHGSPPSAAYARHSS